MKIYTKTGDKGQTSLLGGTRVAKHHIRIDAYGTVDELNSHIGLLRDQKVDVHSKKILIEIQDRLFTMGSELASDPKNPIAIGSKIKIPVLKEEDIFLLEKEIDTMNENLLPMKSFILPGGHPAVSQCHIARSVCRRAERGVIALSENSFVDELAIKYLNRLSDYLFVLSRKFSLDFKAEEIPWKPRL